MAGRSSPIQATLTSSPVRLLTVPWCHYKPLQSETVLPLPKRSANFAPDLRLLPFSAHMEGIMLRCRIFPRGGLSHTIPNGTEG